MTSLGALRSRVSDRRGPQNVFVPLAVSNLCIDVSTSEFEVMRDAASDDRCA
jgi:hypothetical protein